MEAPTSSPPPPVPSSSYSSDHSLSMSGSALPAAPVSCAYRRRGMLFNDDAGTVAWRIPATPTSAGFSEYQEEEAGTPADALRKLEGRHVPSVMGDLDTNQIPMLESGDGITTSEKVDEEPLHVARTGNPAAATLAEEVGVSLTPRNREIISAASANSASSGDVMERPPVILGARNERKSMLKKVRSMSRFTDPGRTVMTFGHVGKRTISPLPSKALRPQWPPENPFLNSKTVLAVTDEFLCTLSPQTEKLDIDVFHPVDVSQPSSDEEENKNTESIISLTMIPAFRSLKYLKITGMLPSYQSSIWVAVFLNPELKYLHLEMALAPKVAPASQEWASRTQDWRPIDGNWKQANVQPRSASLPYSGIDSAGILNPDLGSGEYLDAHCILQAQSQAQTMIHGTVIAKSIFSRSRKDKDKGSLESPKRLKLRITHLHLGNFVVDSLPFFANDFFDTDCLRWIEFGDGCIDAGFVLPEHLDEVVSVSFPSEASVKVVDNAAKDTDMENMMDEDEEVDILTALKSPTRRPPAPRPRPLSAELNQWAQDFDRLENKQLQGQRYTIRAKDSNDVIKLAPRANLDRVLSRSRSNQTLKTLTQTRPTSVEVNSWSQGFGRLENKPLQDQRYVPRAQRSDAQSRSAMGVNLNEALQGSMSSPNLHRIITNPPIDISFPDFSTPQLKFPTPIKTATAVTVGSGKEVVAKGKATFINVDKNAKKK